MSDHELARASTTDGLPPAPSIGPALSAVNLPRRHHEDVGRLVRLCAVSVAVGLAAGIIAQALTALIAVITSIAYFGEVSVAPRAPAASGLGVFAIGVPVLGGLVVGLMARFGSAMIRGHGIPEAMAQVLRNDSRIPPRMMVLKPLSAAVAIGTGGPFGAEGPIIATGGALGSFLGQALPVTAAERKTLLAAGAAAGMAGIFGSPVSATLLAVELLLFEYRARSLLPVVLAVTTAMTVRIAWSGPAAFFAMPPITPPPAPAIGVYVLIGALVGWLAVYVTRSVYAIEDGFGRLPIHWMWWPALGGLVVGVVGYFVPHTLGVGYDNIDGILSGQIVGRVLAVLILFKFLSWSIALGSGTSGGTLAPLFTIGGGLGALFGNLGGALLPAAGVDARVAALVGMAAMFTGASRALLASVVFAAETTWQPTALLPLIGGCAAAYIVSLAFMRHTIMTERLARRGTLVQSNYTVDVLDHTRVSDVASTRVVTLRGTQTLDEVRRWLAGRDAASSHQGFPVVDAHDRLLGVITRRELLDGAEPGDRNLAALLRGTAVTVTEDAPLRLAAELMVVRGIGRLPVVTRREPQRVAGIVTRSDILSAYRLRLHAEVHTERHLTLGALGRWLRRLARSPAAP